MQIFRTIFELPEFPFKMNYHSKSIFFGSCFTENIGIYLKERRFNAIINPFGIIYNPLSISNSIRFLSNNRVFDEKYLNLYNELWFSFYHHGRFSDTDQKKCLEKINTSINEASELIRHADFLFLTFGTAFIYTHKETNEVVANCHKFPSETFTKSLLNPKKIVEEYTSTFDHLLKINPGLKIIFTVSPVRHLKDGAVENQLSKSILFVAIHEIIKKISNCFYFPAYELIMDDLRDYRFYAEDMTHLNATATEYIRLKLRQSMIAEDAQEIMDEMQKLLQAKNHKPFNTDTASYKHFKQNCLKQTIVLKEQYPFLDLREFIEYFG
jgi:hypothetical protein